jgi:hypothetical protein
MKKETVEKLKEVNRLLKEVQSSLEKEGVDFFFGDETGEQDQEAPYIKVHQWYSSSSCEWKDSRYVEYP